jgi:hypothetical protein
VRVWRSNTRGAFHVVDFATGRVTPVATVTTPGGRRPAPPKRRPGRRWGARTPPRCRASSAAGSRAAPSTPTCRCSPSSRPTRARSRTCAATTCGSPSSRRPRHAPHRRRLGRRHQRHHRLGVRGGARPARRVPLEPRLAPPRVLALRPVGGAGLPGGERDRRAVPAGERAALPQGGRAEQPREGRRGRRGGGATRWLAAGPDSGQYLARMDWVGRDSVAVGAHAARAGPARPAHAERRDRAGAHGGHGPRLGRTSTSRARR